MGTARLGASDVERFARLALLLWQRRPGWGYLAFAKIGLALAVLGVSIWIPGLWEMLIQSVAGVVTGTVEPDAVIRLKAGLAYGLVAAGLMTIGISFWLYHRAIGKLGPSQEHDGALSLKVQPNTPLEGLIRAVAETADKVVDFGNLTPAQRALPVLDGVLRASDFEDFMTKAGARTSPPLRLAWNRSDNFYALSAP